MYMDSREIHHRKYSMLKNFNISNFRGTIYDYIGVSNCEV